MKGFQIHCKMEPMIRPKADKEKEQTVKGKRSRRDKRKTRKKQETKDGEERTRS